MKQKKKLGIIIAIVAAVLVVGVIIFFALKPNGINSQEETSEEKGYHELADGENPADIDVKVKSSNDFVKPGKDTLDASKIQGYSAKVGDSDKNDNSKETEKAEQIVLSDSNLTVESIGAYSGSFIEDGSDEATKNVTAMLITNNSDQMLQVTLIDFKVNIGIIILKVAIPLDVVSIYKSCGRMRDGKRSCLIIVDNRQKNLPDMY